MNQAKLRELLETGRCKPWRREFLAQDGTRVPVLLEAVRLPDAEDPCPDVADSQNTEQKLQRLAGRLLNLYDDERRSIARELHDTTAQNLAALSMNLTMLADALDDRRRAESILAECGVLTEECLKEVRSLSYMLHPPLLDELGLAPALRSFVDLFQRSTGISVELNTDPFQRLAPELELAVFRVAQEALFNVHRHSGCNLAEVRLSRTDVSLDISVRDWGKGIDEGTLAQYSLGIAGMRERTRLLGGQLEIQAANPGTLVRAVFPTPRC